MRRLDREIAILGSTSVGKSALTMRFVHDEFSNDYDPTIFKRHTLQTTINGIEYHLTLYDTAGLEQQSQIANSFLKSNGFVLVYSITDIHSFNIVREIYERLADELMQENIPIVLIGNKSDLSEKRNVTFKQGQELAKSINAVFFETSARTGSSVRESFLGLLSIIDNHNPGNASGNRGINDANNRGVNNNLNNQPTGGQQATTSAKRPSTTNKPEGEKKGGCLIS